MKKCPLLNKKCIENECMFWTHLLGRNPQTNAEVDEYNCAISLLPILLIENARNVSQASAAVESFRNESTQFTDKLISGLKGMAVLKNIENEKQLDSPKKDIIDVEIDS